MEKPSFKGPEQIALSRLVDISYESFAQTLRSTRAKVLMLGAFTTEDAAVQAFVRSRKKEALLDGRRRLDSKDAAYLERVREYAREAAEYIKGLRETDGSHAFNESLVSYCSALENCLKGIAIAFRLAQGKFDAQVYVPSERYGGVRNSVMKDWDNAGRGDISGREKVQIFFEKYINEARPANVPYSLPHAVEAEVWIGISTAFQLRNSIVHNVGRVQETIEFDSWRFFAGEHAQVPEQMLHKVQILFEKVVRPFEVSSLGF